MSDIGYLWNAEKCDKVKEDHGVEFWEVVEVLEDPNGFEEDDPQRNEGRFMFVGSTREERILQVIFSDEELPIIRIITAFDANKYWSGVYEDRT